jgi:hypothetical protein
MWTYPPGETATCAQLPLLLIESSRVRLLAVGSYNQLVISPSSWLSFAMMKRSVHEKATDNFACLQLTSILGVTRDPGSSSPSDHSI